VLPEDPDWEIIQARRHEPLANFDTYHRERLKESGLRKRADRRRQSRGGTGRSSARA
jgi:hypothetical protein